MRTLVRSLALALALAGCTQAVPVGSPRAFNRPSRVTFVCLEGEALTTLDECAPVTMGDTTTQRAGFTLIALVPQQTRGEVAAVDLTSDPARVLDSDRRVPGYTFVPVGEIPTAIAVSPVDPRCTWVANQGSRDLSGIETVRFREESLAMGDIGDRFSLLEGTSLVSGRPHAMELIELGGTSELYVTLPDDGAIARVVVTASDTECRFDSIEIIAVPTDVPADPVGAPTDPTLQAPAAQDAATLAVCGDAALEQVASTAPPVVLDPVDPVELGTPMPLEMIVERDEAGAPVALWIGDLARPVVHRFELATRTWVGSLRVAGPVRDLALTPAVPDSLAAGALTRRYLYAIDDRDGTVFVVDASTGHVLPVGPVVARRVDRVPLDASAQAIEVITTDDARRSGAECAAEPLTQPATLRGVFVAVAMSDGTVRFVDVLDADATCRSAGDCRSRLALNETVSFVGRHRPRLSRIASIVTLDDAPTASFGGTSFRYADDGAVPDQGAAPTFGEIGCPPGLTQVFPVDGAARLCTVSDPWAAEPERWQIIWNGGIPGTGSSAGTVEVLGDGSFAIDTRVDLCARGVLGADGATAVPEGEPEAGYAGDALAITGALPEATAEDVGCRTLVGLETSDEAEPVLLPIAEVLVTPDGGTRVVIAPDAPVLGRVGTTAAEVVRCFAPMAGTEEPLAFEVRARDSYVVVGSRSVFLDRVVRGTDRCEVDPTIDPRQIGRAFLGRPFVGQRLAFVLSYGPTEVLRPELTVVIDVTRTPTPLFTDLVGDDASATDVSLPSEVVWNDVDHRLYVVDEVRRGLVPVTVAPLEPQRSIE